MSGAEPDPNSGWLRVGSHTIRYSVRGTEGRPLVIVNGLGSALETWETFRLAMGTQRSIAFDAPGTGGSSTPMQPVTIREVADVALGLVEQLGYPEVDALGYSFGGAVAQEMARAAPTRVRRLILAATNCGWGSPLGDPLAVVSATAGVASLSPRPNLLGYWWQLAAISLWSSFAWLAQVQQPTLVLSAENDRVVPIAAARLLVRELPNARLAVVAEADHSFLLGDAASLAAARVLEFLADDQVDQVDQVPVGSVGGALVCT